MKYVIRYGAEALKAGEEESPPFLRGDVRRYSYVARGCIPVLREVWSRDVLGAFVGGGCRYR